MSSNDKRQMESPAEMLGFPAPAAADAILLEKRRAGTALRRIIDGIITKHPDEGEMSSLATQLEAVAEAFSSMPEKPSRSSFASRMTAEDSRDFIEFSPLAGRSNPIAPPVKIWFEDGKAFGRVRFSQCFEGAPGLAHGGHVAAVFDELLGFTQGLSKRPGMTGTLTITYRAPTPLLTDLRLEGTFDGMKGRKIFTSGWLYAGELLLAEAKGIFIALTDEQHAAVLRARGETEQRRTGSQATDVTS